MWPEVDSWRAAHEPLPRAARRTARWLAPPRAPRGLSDAKVLGPGTEARAVPLRRASGKRGLVLRRRCRCCARDPGLARDRRYGRPEVPLAKRARNCATCGGPSPRTREPLEERPSADRFGSSWGSPAPGCSPRGCRSTPAWTWARPRSLPSRRRSWSGYGAPSSLRASRRGAIGCAGLVLLVSATWWSRSARPSRRCALTAAASARSPRP